MREERELIARQSVIELHQWIEDVFTNNQQKGNASMEKLLASFSPDFSMITTGCQSVTLNQVEALFRNNIGSRPGLKIDIDACEVIISADDHVALRYRETHTRDGEIERRWSLVIITFSEGNACWHYLHETPAVE
ncbi:hypothetical protein EAE91_11310 [Photorhabdus noenieputensis]|uniref:hypothetical protein n=1 Tax=Photorhabdus TaxID=29487 RepID=UPI001BD44B5A|nr:MULTISPECIES: hypothetical protein [Photorhabdus]MBS9425204.1 hypothetical protein [Photorhabdus caribbeanensis]MBS9437731.1 hypothetical protein [Photorhabdus noenieputensis]MCK3667883.1 hypothetical protein [Photorhabdus noenieputensis]